MFCAKYVVLRQIELIFCDHRRQALEFKVARILIWTNLLFYTASALLFILACIPRAKISDPSLPGNCIDVHARIIGTSAINVASDFAILVTPIAAIWRLQMPAKKKIGVTAVFGVGAMYISRVALVASVARLRTSIRLVHDDDVASSIIPFAVWVLGELNAVILVACFPYFPRLYDHMSNKTQSPRRIPSNDSPPMVPETSAFGPRDLSLGVGVIA
ncbi:hypothetical protein NUW58_g456 [Xylaria curta]|uniref:Uncharacterized protein n=1 Tax=Xylaria curta TaxID=42375 RepID=A0ACC1PQT2_9PEZI|nr:hypothetical protein NUW58_g456 [Xylaria curta]